MFRLLSSIPLLLSRRRRTKAAYLIHNSTPYPFFYTHLCNQFLAIGATKSDSTAILASVDGASWAVIDLGLSDTLLSIT